MSSVISVVQMDFSQQAGMRATVEREMHKRKFMGRRLKELRRRIGLSQEQLAERAETSPNYISRMERGTENPTLSMLLKLSEALDVDPHEILDFMHQDDPNVLKKELRKLAERIDAENGLKMAVRLLRVVSDASRGERGQESRK